MGGHIIRIAPGSAQSINPFDLVPAGLDLSRYVQQQQGDRLAEKIQNLHNFLDILLANNAPSTSGTDLSEERGLLDDVLYEAYARAGITTDPWTHGRPAPLLQDVALVLRKDKKDKNALRLADRLQRFITGSMAGLFSRPTNVALTAPLLDFDLREMRGGSEIKPAGIFLISEFLWTQALSQRRPRRLYIDEAWSLIKYQEGGEFLERMAREMRKYYVSVVTITQNPEQFVTDAHGSVIAQNAFTKVLKRLDSIGADAASTAFGLSPAEKQRLTRLERKKALLLVGSKRLIVEINASAQEYALVQTDPQAQQQVAPRVVAVRVTQEEQGKGGLPALTSATLPNGKQAGRSLPRHSSLTPLRDASSSVAEPDLPTAQQEDEGEYTDLDGQEEVAPLPAAVTTMQEDIASSVQEGEADHPSVPAMSKRKRTRPRRSSPPSIVLASSPVTAPEAQAGQHTSNGQAVTATTPGGAR
jgi:hypothetical protein